MIFLICLIAFVTLFLISPFVCLSDEGISGKNIVDRPAINRLIDDIKSGKVNNILVFKVDRLTRNTKNLLELVELFNQYDCTFSSLTESIDTQTASGRMFLKIIGIFAEFERENIIERIKVGCERKVREGYTLANNNISYGYRKATGERVQTPHPDESIIVREIYSMFVEQNISMTQIARRLNERKILTKSKSAPWVSATIKAILTNPNNIGKVRYSTEDKERYFEVDGQHEPIISVEMFNLATEKIKNFPNISRTKRPREESYYCSVLYCSMCQSRLSTHNNWSNFPKKGETKKQYKSSYRCVKKLSLDDDRFCKCPDISHDKVERAFCEYIEQINDFTETTVDLEETAEKAQREILQAIVEYEKQLSALYDRKKQTMERYASGEIEFDEYKAVVSVINERGGTLENELQRKKSELPTATETPDISTEDIITNIRQNWEHLSNNERMMFLHRFVKKIVVTIKKQSKTWNTVKIDSIEFHTGELQKATDTLNIA